jgi:hypothetical protein
LLERLLGDPAAPRAQRRAALRSLVLLAVTPATAQVAERLLRDVALDDERLGPGAEAVVTRGVGTRDPARARAILGSWAASPELVLRRRGTRGLERLTEMAAA